VSAIFRDIKREVEAEVEFGVSRGTGAKTALYIFFQSEKRRCSRPERESREEEWKE
jgi:hypothetical protein